MVNPNNNFEEFEFDDDIDESWENALDDDDISDDNDIDLNAEENLAKASKAKPMIKLVLLLSLLIGASFGAYSFIAISNEEKNIPIVNIDKHSVMNTDQRETKNNINFKTTDVISKEITKHSSEINTRTPDTLQKKIGQHTILTPMPDGTDANDVTLANLNPKSKNTDKINVGTVSSSNIIATRSLSEDELLSKTESLYEKNVSETLIHKSANIEPALALEKDMHVTNTHVEDNVVKTMPIKDIISPSVKPLVPKKYSKNSIIAPKIVSTAPKNAKQITKKFAWTIRAAQYGKAVVYDKINKEMKSIEVNDTLPNIGRIKSIQLKNGRWIITGTKGNILQ